MHTAARARPQIAPPAHPRGQPAPCQLHGVPLWFYQGPPHPTRLGSYQAPGRAGFRSTLYAVPLQSAPVSHKRPALSLISMCSTAAYLSPLLLSPPAHTACATALYHMPHRTRRLVSPLPHLYGLEGLLYTGTFSSKTASPPHTRTQKRWTRSIYNGEL